MTSDKVIIERIKFTCLLIACKTVNNFDDTTVVQRKNLIGG